MTVIYLRRISLLAIAAAFAATVAASAAGAIDSSARNRYGGPVFAGAPALVVTAALVQAGGGAGHFSIAQALTSMVGSSIVSAEVAKLTKQYGKSEVAVWVKGFNFSVEDSLRVATKSGVTLPAPPADLRGKILAVALVNAGVDPKTHVFWAGLLYDHAVSHDIHNQVMSDIDQMYGSRTDLITHKLSNQAMFDLAHVLGNSSVKLALLH